MLNDGDFRQESCNPKEPGEEDLCRDTLDEMEIDEVDSEPKRGRSPYAREPYLREMAQIPILTQEAKTEIWVRLERAQACVAEVVFSYPEVAKEVFPTPNARSIDRLGWVMTDLVSQREELFSQAARGAACSELTKKEDEIVYLMNKFLRDLSITDRQVDLFLEKLINRLEFAAGAMEECEWFLSSSQVAHKGGFLHAAKVSGKRRLNIGPVLADGKNMPGDSAQVVRAESKIRKKREKLEKSIHSLLKAREDARRVKSDIVAANLRLVLSAAKKYVYGGMEFMDLVQEGNLGLMKAVERYDYRLGYKFSTYAIWWIRQGITRAVQEQSKTIRTPVHLVELIHKMRQSYGELIFALGRQPSPGEIAKKMGASTEKVERLLGMVGRRYVSLEDPIGDGESQLKEIIGDTSKASPEEEFIQKDLAEKVIDLLENLDPREVKVLRKRFGLGGAQDSTLKQVGEEFGVTRERIRQIEKNALKKLSRLRKVQDAR
jgi:RNA polymerase sigma factor (sigma-70 family)